MKKITVFLAVLVLVATLPTFAFAKNVTCSGGSGAPGDQVTMTIDVDDITGIGGYNIDFTYDPDILTADSAAAGPSFAGYLFIPNLSNPGVVALAVAGAVANPDTGAGELASVTFTIKDGAFKNSAIQFTRTDLKDPVPPGGNFPGTTSDNCEIVVDVTITVTVTPASADVVAGESATLTAEIFADGTHVDATDVSDVTWATSGTGTFSNASLNGSNNVQIDYTPPGTPLEDATITATENLTGKDAEDESNLVTIPGPAAALVEVSGNGQSGTVGTQLEDPFVVKVTDQFGNPVMGFNVGFAVTIGEGSLSEDNVSTGADGMAASTLTLWTVAETNQVKATGTGLTGSPVNFEAIGTPGPLAALGVAVAQNTITAGQTNEVTVTAVDEFGNKVPSFTGTVTLTSSDPNATFDPNPYTYLAGDFGEKTFDAILTTAGAQTVTAATNGISNFDDVTVNPAAASKVGLVADEMVLASDQKGSSNLTATLLDPFDNTVPSAGVTVNLVISDNTYVALDNDSPTTTDGEAAAVLTTKSGTVDDPPQATSVTATSTGLADSGPVEFALVNFSIQVVSPDEPFTNETGVHLVTSDSMPSVAEFMGVGSDPDDYQWSLASCGTISNATGLTVTYNAPDNLDDPDCEDGKDTLTATSIENELLSASIDIFMYDPVEITWPTEPAGIALGDESYGVTASGGTEVYEFDSTDDAVATVDADTGAILPVAVGVFNAEVIDEEFGDFDVDNGYFDESAEIEICEAIVILPKPPTDTLLSEDMWDFGATGACDSGEVDWEASDGEIDADGNYTAPSVDQGDSVDVTITAYDKTYNADSATPIKTEYMLTVNGVLGIEAEPGFDPEVPIPSGDTVQFAALGGDGNYTWAVAGPVAVDGGTGDTFDFLAPSEGAFAGPYTITVEDGADFTDDFLVRVPMAVDPETFNMLEGENLVLSILGAPEGTTFTVTQFDAKGNEVEAGDFEFLDQPSSPDQNVRYEAPDDLEEILSFLATWTADTLDDSLEDAGLDEITSGFYTVMPVESFAGTFEDDLGEVSGVTVEITAPSAWQAITNTNDSGDTDADFAFDLPVSGTMYWFRASKAGYLTTVFTSADLTGETAEDNVIVLTPAGEDASITGTVTILDGEPDGPVDVLAYYEEEGVPVLAGIATAASPFRFDFEADNSPYTLTASIPGFFDEEGVSGDLPEVGVDLNLTPNAGDECITDPVVGGKVADDLIFVEVPFGSVDTSLGDDPFCFDLDTDVDTWACGRGAGDVIYQIDADVTFVGSIIITLPFDLALVPPGGFESGDYAVYQADSLGDCESVETIPSNQIVAVDYVGDGFTGEVTFLASHLSDFGISVGEDDDVPCLNCNKDDDRCFIATAAYGSPFDKHVKVLRQFRNAYLLPTKVGRAFVNAYYSLSPAAADFIANHDTLRALTRTALLPFVGMSYLMLQLGFFGTMLALASALLICLGLWKMGHGRMKKAAFLAVPLLLAVLMVVGSAEARQKKGWYVAGYGVFAYENLDTDDTKKKINCPVSVDFDDSWGVQARAGHTYNEYFQLEGMYEYITPFKADKDALDDKLDVMHFSVNGKFTCPVYDMFVPYAIVGLGALTTYEDLKYKDGLSRNCKTSEWGFGARVGLGFDLYFNPSWAMGFEGAYVFGTGDVDSARYGSFALGLGYHW